MATTNDNPIGVFDSGVGGLTVMRSIVETLPDEDVVYLGDTARVPYGNRNADTVRRYALNATDMLLGREIKALVVACNTAPPKRPSVVGKGVLTSRRPCGREGHGRDDRECRQEGRFQVFHGWLLCVRLDFRCEVTRERGHAPSPPSSLQPTDGGVAFERRVAEDV